jgi:hypothetical protein
MLLAGIKFGIGFYLGIVIVLVLGTATICLAAWIWHFLTTPKRGPCREERAPNGVEWKRTSTSAPRDDGTIQSFSFCSVIRWEDQEDRKKRRQRDGVR